MESLITYTLEGQVAFIGLNRAEKCNALNEELGEQLADAVMRAVREARVGILFGHGRNFSGGLDLNLLSQQPRGRATQIGQLRRKLNYASEVIAQGEIPFISALHGAVIGWGLEIAACTHIRIADETAYFALPEAQRGIFVGGGGSVRIARLMSVARMTDMMLTGRVLTATEGERYNLVQYLVAAGEAIEKAHELASKIARTSPLVNHAIASGLPHIRDMAPEQGLYVEALLNKSILQNKSDGIKPFTKGEKVVTPGADKP